MADTRGMLARLRKLERSRGAGEEMCDWISENFGAAVADGRMCPADGPVVLHCLLNWISDGTARSGIAGEGLLR
ncbi:MULTISPECIES: hypothetical protein [Pseudomonas]|uniref:hypothetical protein n=1 Tax=Pseudomonas TaxID=286 RepID=UPI00053E5120|nr:MULTISPECIES: hypothetical protein [Pseudomonas]EKV2942557.1 hypothetical protein [Pseudomonas aeruginosa]KAF0595143.1 hypothetical protein PAPB9_01918 [Pseudomonas aeruginosa]KSC79870.1 hypothetical protein AO891_13630 [Pseudomonas aeruginosa]KSE20853.1 hypothetical protein AO907_12930 [Pseudomonas aeruginosa]KSF93727.1 hypothetical protein AO938_05175 [Pseudomonas aeruginosa]